MILPTRAAGNEVRTPKTTEPDATVQADATVPEPTPYQPSVGRMFGIAGAGIAGAGIGAGLVSVAGFIDAFASMPLGIIDSKGFLLAVAGAAVAGAAILGSLTHSSGESVHLQRERDRIAAEFGTPIKGSAAAVVEEFDHDGSGSIDLVNPTGLPGRDERVKSESRIEQDGGFEYNWWDNDVDYRSNDREVTISTSAAALFAAADDGPRDEVVTESEIASLMSSFDEDGSGTLTTAEQARFAEAHPLVTEEH